MKQLVFNGMQVPNGPLLVSRFRHDCESFTNDEGKFYMVDGGLAYARYSNPGDGEHILVYADDPFEKVREWAFRWNNRIGEWVTLKDIADDWLEAILDYYIVNPQGEMVDDFKLLYLQEQLFRAEKEY